uniref:ATP synthase complex subunit 8 n=1 Tax=Engaeus cunicularius TaxID=99757 RepID=W9A203_9EUCA|nr:ATP synthase F0 subunit 8 [Engaeus cunicularius]CDN85534.1 ATP synthase F0 subunit 8 [Engaeus cunicularius]
MPQMSPLLWLNLFMFFILGFLLFSIINYYILPKNKKEISTSNINPTQKIWKW